MSARSTEQNYKIAKNLYQDISDDFYEIENNSEDDDAYLIDQTLDDIKRMIRHINRINLEDLTNDYDARTIETLDNNIDTFREAGYYIERALMSAKLFDKVHPVLDEYMKKVDWKPIADTQEDAIKKFGRFLTNESNYEQYKTIIGNIVKGTMNQKAFGKLFDQVSQRILKPKGKKTAAQRNPLPPQMWPEEDQEKWQKMKDEWKKEAEKSREDDQFKRVDFDESFITLKEFKKLTS